MPETRINSLANTVFRWRSTDQSPYSLAWSTRYIFLLKEEYLKKERGGLKIGALGKMSISHDVKDKVFAL